MGATWCVAAYEDNLVSAHWPGMSREVAERHARYICSSHRCEADPSLSTPAHAKCSDGHCNVLRAMPWPHA